jgi:hypothetical protein
LAQARVLGIQRKLHKSSIDDQDRRFKDLHNLVCDPATLMVARLRVRANRGSRSAGVDGQTARYIEQVLGVQKFLDGLREELRSGTSPSGRCRSEGGTYPFLARPYKPPYNPRLRETRSTSSFLPSFLPSSDAAPTVA